MTGTRVRRRRRLGTLIALMISLVGSSAAGQTPVGTVQAKPAREEDAQREFEEGQKAANAKQWDKAREAFARAFATAPQPRRALALARAELTLNKHRDAAEHFAYVLREAKDLSPAEKKEVEASLAKCVAKVGSLIVKVAPAGADVFIDDDLVGTSPLTGPVYVEPGSHRVEAKFEGNQPVSERVGLVAGASLDVEMTLSDTAGESKIKVKVRNDSAGNAIDNGVKPTPIVSTRNKKVIYAGIGVGAGLAAIGLGTGIAAGIINKQAYDAWDANGCASARSDCREAFDEKDKLRSQVGSTAVWLSIGAVIVGGATVVYAVTGKKQVPKTTGGIVVLPNGGAAFVLTGHLW